MKKDYKFIEKQIKVAKIRAVGSSILGFMALFGGIYVISLFNLKIEKTIAIIVVIGLFLLSFFALYTNISAIKKYKSFLE